MESTKAKPELQIVASKGIARNVGRPKAVTPEVVHELIDNISRGFDVTSACILSGISTSTYYNELARNQRFMDKMTIAQRSPIILANGIVIGAINQGDLKTAKWLLEREDRRELHAQRAAVYSKLNKLTITETQQNSRSIKLEVSR
jgi:hypothetical protein